MEINKDSAIECLSKGKQLFNQGKYEESYKYFQRSKRLYTLPDIDIYIKKAEEKMEQKNTSNQHKNQPKSEVRKRKKTVEVESEDNNEKNYTPEQKELADKINGLDDYYEILGLKKDANDTEIKKGYRKFALQLHPDKNPYKGSEEAFKKVSEAYTVLSDKDKRSNYDQFGKQSVQHNEAYANQDFDPNDLFNMFFGGGGAFQEGFVFINGRNGQRYQRHPFDHQHGFGHRYRNNYYQDDDDNNGGRNNFFRINPLYLLLLIFLLLNLFLGYSGNSYDYSMNETRHYTSVVSLNLRKVTKELDNINYYVTSSIKGELNTNIRLKRSYDITVCRDYVSSLKSKYNSMYWNTKNKEEVYEKLKIFVYQNVCDRL